jgi:DNA-directed RNA polymerase specialized sigma24 family protein
MAISPPEKGRSSECATKRPSVNRIAEPNPCVRDFPFPPSLDPDAGKPGYIFPTWRAALADAQARIAGAYEARQRLVRAASDAGLSYREIGEAIGLSAAAVGKIVNRSRATLDDPAVT